MNVNMCIIMYLQTARLNRWQISSQWSNLCFVSDPRIRSYTVTCHTADRVNKLSVFLCKTTHWVELPVACKMCILNPLVPSSWEDVNWSQPENLLLYWLQFVHTWIHFLWNVHNRIMCFLVLENIRFLTSVQRQQVIINFWCKWGWVIHWKESEMVHTSDAGWISHFSMSTVAGCGLIGLFSEIQLNLTSSFSVANFRKYFFNQSIITNNSQENKLYIEFSTTMVEIFSACRQAPSSLRGRLRFHSQWQSLWY